MPALQYLDNFTQGNILLSKQHQEVVHKVGSLAKEEALVVVLALNDEFHCLFTHLLCDLIEATTEEMVGIGTFLRVFASIIDDLLKVEEELAGSHLRGVIDLAEAGIATCMTDRSCRNSLDKQGVMVTILDDLAHRQIVATRLSFGPKLLTAS